jgi:hypothetical protein
MYEIIPLLSETSHQLTLSPELARLIAVLAQAILFHGLCLVLIMVTMVKF